MTIAQPNVGFFQLNYRKVKPQHERLLLTLYKWIFSDNHPIFKVANGKKWYLVNYNYLSKVLETGYMNVRNWMKRLCGDSVNDVPYIYKRIEKCKSKGYLSYAWISINTDVAKQALDKDSDEYKFLTSKPKRRRKMSDALFEIEDSKIHYPEESIAIANHIILKYSQYFPHKIPLSNNKVSNTYSEVLRKITDVYNGSFTNPRVYSFSEEFLNNKSFSINGWKDKINEVKGDWGKVRNLILRALKNFDTMHLPNYMPFSKKYLQTNLSLWFYDSYNGQSQFIQSMFEPLTILTQISEMKADRIYDELPGKVQVAGNRFFDMNPDIGAVTLWDNMRKMTEWARAVFYSDRSTTYWGSSYTEIPLKFQQFCEDNNIKVTPSILSIEKSVDNNLPWCWFVQRAIERHGLNSKLDMCKTAEDVYNLYGKDIPF